MDKQEEGFRLALQNKKLIYGALKKAGVFNLRFDYEDFVQEGLITYANCYANYEKEFDLEKFNVYAYQKIVWQTIDFLRKEQKYNEKHDLNDFSVIDFEKQNPPNVVEVFKDITNFTKQEEYLILNHFIYNVPLSTIAKDWHVSDRYLRKIRTQLKEKIKKSISN